MPLIDQWQAFCEYGVDRVVWIEGVEGNKIWFLGNRKQDAYAFSNKRCFAFSDPPRIPNNAYFHH